MIPLVYAEMYLDKEYWALPRWCLVATVAFVYPLGSGGRSSEKPKFPYLAGSRKAVAFVLSPAGVSPPVQVMENEEREGRRDKGTEIVRREKGRGGGERKEGGKK